MQAPIDLNGMWRATQATEAIRRAYPDLDYDGEGWVEAPVPGHWQEAKGLTYSDGPVIYRKQFESPRPPADVRSWLRLEGIFYESDVWCDGDYLGDTEGYFFPHVFEITEALAQRERHVLGVEVACSRPRDLTAKRNITGVFQHWDSSNPNTNPGGLWRPVNIEFTGPVAIQKYRVVCVEANAEKARLAVRVVVDAREAVTALLRTAVRRQNSNEVVAEHTEVRPLAAGANRLKWQVHLDDPHLWWPHSLGEQPLYDVTLDVVVGDPENESSHSRHVRTGIREVRMDEWIFRINGERLFLKGTNLGPTRMRLGSVAADDVVADVHRVREAGLDLARVHGHISRPELYAAADEAGLLLWQDLPMQWGYARSVRKAAAHQAREAVDLLGHHPSIITWCGHNQPIALDVGPDTNRMSGRYKLRRAALQQLPTWNRTVLGTTVRRALSEADPSRPVNAYAGAMPNLASLGGDTQLLSGWETPDIRDLDKLTTRLPRLVRFVSAFGAQAVPHSSEFIDAGKWPDIDFEQLVYLHAYERELFELHVAPGDFNSFEDWREASQIYQAQLIKHHVETLRRLKYRPTGGFCQYLFADADPTVSFSVLDHERRPKAGYTAFVDACRSVIVVAQWPEAAYRAGRPVGLDVHAISDLRKPVHDAEVTARIDGAGDQLEWRWGGSVEADGISHVGTVRFVAPTTPGPLTLSLELRSPEAEASNKYELFVEPSTDEANQVNQ